MNMSQHISHSENQMHLNKTMSSTIRWIQHINNLNKIQLKIKEKLKHKGKRRPRSEPLRHNERK